MPKEKELDGEQNPPVRSMKGLENPLLPKDADRVMVKYWTNGEKKQHKGINNLRAE
jgi:hypothetical protein